MGSFLIEYRYDGDENIWRSTIDSFLQCVKDDANLSGKFRYSVFIKEDGVSRVHIPSWDSEETLEHLKAQAFFAEFSKKVQELAGDSLRTTKPTRDV